MLPFIVEFLITQFGTAGWANTLCPFGRQDLTLSVEGLTIGMTRDDVLVKKGSPSSYQDLPVTISRHDLNAFHPTIEQHCPVSDVDEFAQVVGSNLEVRYVANRVVEVVGDSLEIADSRALPIGTTGWGLVCALRQLPVAHVQWIKGGKHLKSRRLVFWFFAEQRLMAQLNAGRVTRFFLRASGAPRTTVIDLGPDELD